MESVVTELISRPLPQRLEAIADDVSSGRDRYRAIAPHVLASLLGVNSSKRPDGDWTFIAYAERRRIEDYVVEIEELETFADYLEDKIPAQRCQELRQLFARQVEASTLDLSFLTPDERVAIESTLNDRELKKNLENGRCTIAQFKIKTPKLELWFEGEIEDDGACLTLKTPYDRRDGSFRDLSGCVTEEW